MRKRVAKLPKKPRTCQQRYAQARRTTRSLDGSLYVLNSENIFFSATERSQRIQPLLAKCRKVEKDSRISNSEWSADEFCWQTSTLGCSVVFNPSCWHCHAQASICFFPNYYCYRSCFSRQHANATDIPLWTCKLIATQNAIIVFAFSKCTRNSRQLFWETPRSSRHTNTSMQHQSFVGSEHFLCW